MWGLLYGNYRGKEAVKFPKISQNTKTVEPNVRA